MVGNRLEVLIRGEQWKLVADAEPGDQGVDRVDPSPLAPPKGWASWQEAAEYLLEESEKRYRLIGRMGLHIMELEGKLAGQAESAKR